ncbi:MAG TPA: hypothetical protein VG326_16420 [Tepidisphaeraceae bacterium]|jgi:hypothetical protein|nr:hypothetical protein [Tepidisphaeraceae bacterium]
MEIERIRELRLAHPFVPFNLVLKDGRKLPVDQPYYLAIAPDKSFISHSSVGGGFECVRPDWVADVDYTDPAGERWNTPDHKQGQGAA